jgi:hypothetical protein
MHFSDNFVPESVAALGLGCRSEYGLNSLKVRLTLNQEKNVTALTQSRATSAGEGTM